MSKALLCTEAFLLIKSIGEELELEFPDGSNRYDGNKPYHHPHIICIKCKEIVDLDLNSMDVMVKEVVKGTNFKIMLNPKVYKLQPRGGSSGNMSNSYGNEKIDINVCVP